MSDSDDSDFFVDESPKKKAPAKKPAGEKKASAKPKEPKEKKEKCGTLHRINFFCFLFFFESEIIYSWYLDDNDWGG